MAGLYALAAAFLASFSVVSVLVCTFTLFLGGGSLALMRLPPSLAVCIIYYNYTTRTSTKQIDAYQEFFYELRGTSSRSSLLSDLRSLPCLECPVGGIIGVGLLLFGAADGLRKRLSGRRSLCQWEAKPMPKPDEQLVEQAQMVLDFNWNGEYTRPGLHPYPHQCFLYLVWRWN